MSIKGESVIQYGGVSLPFVKTEKFTQETIYSPDGVDSIYTKITIGVSCVLNDCLIGGDVKTWLNNNSKILMSRGLKLYYILDGVYVYPAAPDITQGTTVVESPVADWNGTDYVPPEGMTDAKLGPKPIRFDVKQIQGNTILAYYEIETYIPYCYSGGTPGLFLSNRWESSIEVDDEYFISRTIAGTLVINGQYEVDNPVFVPSGSAIDLMVSQNIIIPGVPNRWKRESIKIGRSSDGLIVNYTIVDKQLYSAIPRPATKIEANYTESWGDGKNVAWANMLNAELNIMIYGQPNSSFTPGVADQNKYDLMKLMFQLILTRIKNPFTLAQENNTMGPDGMELITYFQLKEDMFKPILGCVVKTYKVLPLSSNPVGKVTSFASAVWQYTNVAKAIDLADIIADVETQPTTIGNYGQFLVAANALVFTTSMATAGYLGHPTSPCDGDTLKAINIGSTTYTYSGNPVVFVQNITSVPTDLASSAYGKVTNNHFGMDTYKNPYTEYTLETQFLTDNYIIQCPIMYDVTSTATSCVFAQTAAPVSKKIIHWTAGRIGHWPKAPDPVSATKMTSGTAEDKLLDYHITFQTSKLIDGIKRKYEIGGVYEIGMARRLQWDVVGGVVNTAVNPQTDDIWGSTYNTYPASLFTTGIVGYSTLSPGA